MTVFCETFLSFFVFLVTYFYYFFFTLNDSIRQFSNLIRRRKINTVR